jgi:hypothetical protein
MSIATIGLLIVSAATVRPAEPCVQAEAHRARTAHIDSSFAVTGAGSTQRADGTQMFVWTGTDCIAWIQFRGPLAVNADWQSFAASPGAELIAHDESSAGRRDFTIAPDGSVSFAVDGRRGEMNADDHTWLRGMVLEYVRRAGVGAPARAAEIAVRGGVVELLAEARRVTRDAVRARYLIAGFQFVDSTTRPTFIRDAAAMLGTAGEAAELLLAIPRGWRSDERVLSEAYAASARIEPDEYVEQILRALPSRRPTPALLRPLIERMISTLQNVDRRTALRAYYLDASP